jgi:hypothetical protein
MRLFWIGAVQKRGRRTSKDWGKDKEGDGQVLRRKAVERRKRLASRGGSVI